MCGNTTPPHHHRGAAFSVESSLLGGLDNVRCAPESDRIADIVEGPSRADTVEKVTAEKLWNNKTQQSNRTERIFESTLRTGA